jgi:hypothetical protein
LPLPSEELYLAKAKYIKGDAWSIWQKGIASMMARRIFKEAWAETRSEYDAYGEFQEFVDSYQ